MEHLLAAERQLLALTGLKEKLVIVLWVSCLEGQTCDNCHLAGLFHKGVRAGRKEFPGAFLTVLLLS